MDFSFLRKNMVDCQLKPNKIINLDLIDAFLKVPREIFVNKKILINVIWMLILI